MHQRFLHVPNTQSNWWEEPLAQLLNELGTATVICRDQNFLTRVDDALWRTPETSFLPHGENEDDPIHLVTNTTEKQVENLVFLDLPESAQTETEAKQIHLLFNAQDKTLSQARKLWKSSQEQGVEQSYWKFTSTSFVKER
jgi:DNA polymerase IIIc chi subunit